MQSRVIGAGWFPQSTPCALAPIPFTDPLHPLAAQVITCLFTNPCALAPIPFIRWSHTGHHPPLVHQPPVPSSPSPSQVITRLERLDKYTYFCPTPPDGGKGREGEEEEEPPAWAPRDPASYTGAITFDDLRARVQVCESVLRTTLLRLERPCWVMS